MQRSAGVRGKRRGVTPRVEILLPWASYFGEANAFDPAKTTLFDTFYQLCAHGVHHRAQINTLLRELGISPPLIDYIGWAWRGRPDPVWPES